MSKKAACSCISSWASASDGSLEATHSRSTLQPPVRSASRARTTMTLTGLFALFNGYLLARLRGVRAPLGDGFLRPEERVADGEEIDQPHRELEQVGPRVPAHEDSEELPEGARRAKDWHLGHVPQRVEERRDDTSLLYAHDTLGQEPGRHDYEERPGVLEEGPEVYPRPENIDGVTESDGRKDARRRADGRLKRGGGARYAEHEEPRLDPLA